MEGRTTGRRRRSGGPQDDGCRAPKANSYRTCESVEREFKSDRRRISDSEVYEEVVALANTLGGVLLIGVEADGTVPGAQPRHGRRRC